MTNQLFSKIIQKGKHCACSSKIFKLTMSKCNAKQPSKCYVRYQVLTALNIMNIFWDETPCFQVDTLQRSGKTGFIHFTLPKLEPTCFPKTVIPVYQSAWCHIPDYCSLTKRYSIVLWQGMQLQLILNMLTSTVTETNAFWKHNWSSQNVFSSNDMSHFQKS